MLLTIEINSNCNSTQGRQALNCTFQHDDLFSVTFSPQSLLCFLGNSDLLKIRPKTGEKLGKKTTSTD